MKVKQTNNVYFAGQVEKHCPKRYSELKQIIKRGSYSINIISNTNNYHYKNN